MESRQTKDDGTPATSSASSDAKASATATATTTVTPTTTATATATATATPGRWHRDEHTRFMAALELYGDDKSGEEWSKIADYVQSKSLEEVRRHGHRYLQHLIYQQQQLLIHHQQQQQAQEQTQTAFRVDPMHFPLTASREMQAQQAQAQAQAQGTPTAPRQPNQNDPNQPNHATASRTSTNVPSSTSNTSGRKSRTTKPRTSKPRARRTTNKSTDSHEDLDKNAAAGGAMLTAITAPSDVEVSLSPSPAKKKKKKKRNSATGSAANRTKEWNFQEDKTLETSLAAWANGKPYSWPKLASSLPGKNARDVRARYDLLVTDVAAILHAPASNPTRFQLQQHQRADGEKTGKAAQNLPYPFPPISASMPKSRSSAIVGAASSFRSPVGLRNRIAPPPPILVPPPVGKGKPSSQSSSLLLDSPGLFSSGRNTAGGSGGPSLYHTHGTGVTAANSGIGMLSPTFLDFLAVEDKLPSSQVLPYSSPATACMTTSSISSPHPSSSLALLSASAAARAELQIPPLSSPLGLGLGLGLGTGLDLYTSSGSKRKHSPHRESHSKTSDNAGYGGNSGSSNSSFATPRIWQEFLSDDFKFDSQISPHATLPNADASIAFTTTSTNTTTIAVPKKNSGFEDHTKC